LLFAVQLSARFRQSASYRTAARRTRTGRATETVIGRNDPSLRQLLHIKIKNRLREIVRQSYSQHLIKVAVRQPACPIDAYQITAHQTLERSRILHRHLVVGVMRLDAVNQARAAANRRCEMYGFSHLFHIRPVFQARICKRVDAVRTLNRYRDRQSNRFSGRKPEIYIANDEFKLKIYAA